jgi:hypothetical protein
MNFVPPQGCGTVGPYCNRRSRSPWRRLGDDEGSRLCGPLCICAGGEHADQKQEERSAGREFAKSHREHGSPSQRGQRKPKAAAAEVHPRRLEIHRRYVNLTFAAVTSDLQHMARRERCASRRKVARSIRRMASASGRLLTRQSPEPYPPSDPMTSRMALASSGYAFTRPGAEAGSPWPGAIEFPRGRHSGTGVVPPRHLSQTRNPVVLNRGHISIWPLAPRAT